MNNNYKKVGDALLNAKKTIIEYLTEEVASRFDGEMDTNYGNTLYIKNEDGKLYCDDVAVETLDVYETVRICGEFEDTLNDFDFEDED